mmetsp:Transcript_17702/g.17116  ORF Transcript_17702/g.17116 Transcript_17702/m.17116 type:complete len:367 (-) Transcript_17702:38-1138(-)
MLVVGVYKVGRRIICLFGFLLWMCYQGIIVCDATGGAPFGRIVTKVDKGASARFVNKSSSLSTSDRIEILLSRISDWQREHREEQRQNINEINRNDNKNNKDDDDYDLPFVLVTFAQTLDGMIATKTNSSNFAISCTDSLILTHGLRSIHSAVLIGGRTLAIDNPRLSNRLFPTHDDTSQPQAVVIDTHLRHVLCMIGNSSSCCPPIRARPLLVCCSHQAAQKYQQNIQLYNLQQRQMAKPLSRQNTQDAILLEPCLLASNDNNSLDLKHLLHNLKTKRNIYSIMVEGGSSILSSFLVQPNLIQALLITISPSFMGAKHGLPALSKASFSGKNDDPLFKLDHDATFYSQLGPDLILLASLHSNILS